MRGLLARYTNSLAHLSVDWRLRRTAVMRDALLLRVLLHLCAMTLVLGLALSLLFLLLRLPFLSNFLEFFWCSLCAVRLHRDVRVKVVQSTICLLAAVPATLVHALNLFVASTRSLVLLRAWNWYE